MSSERPRSGTASTPITLRVPNRQLDLIDRAAASAAKNRTQFMIDTACREAREVLLDQTAFYLDDAAWSAFAAALDAPPDDNPRLAALLRRKPSWEK